MRWVAQRARHRGLLACLVCLGFLITLSTILPTSAFAEGSSPPKHSPFDGPIGGDQLGRTDEVVHPENELSPPPEVTAKAFLVADLDTGAVYAAKNAHQRQRPASTLKTLTALTLLPRLDERAVYTATAKDANVEGSKAGLRSGQDYTIEQLFYGMLLPSGNDAASALASANRGMDNTVQQMTQEARRLGAYDTTVANTSGLDADGQLSSAYDLALFGRAAMQNEDFVRYVTTPTVKFPGKGDKPTQLQNTNDLLTEYAGAIGVKNGYTSKAGHTLIGAAEREGQRLLVVMLGSDKDYTKHATQLLDWGFDAGNPADQTSAGTNNDKDAAGTTKNPGTDAAPPSVGQLVRPVDVTRAAEGKVSGVSRSSRAVEESIGPTERGIGEKPNDERLAAAAVGMLNTPAVLLLAGGMIFIVLASLRVRSYVRGHHRQ